MNCKLVGKTAFFFHFKRGLVTSTVTSHDRQVNFSSNYHSCLSLSNRGPRKPFHYGDHMQTHKTLPNY